MRKPTGRPRGRPKTRYYVTIMARMPLDLAAQVRRYAAREHQSVSQVLRDGLLLLLEGVHERKTPPIKPLAGLPGTLFFGCHQCEGDAASPTQWVGWDGRVFIFCDNDCLRTWIENGEAQVVQEAYQECQESAVTEAEKAEYEKEVEEAFVEETKHYQRYGTLANFKSKEDW